RRARSASISSARGGSILSSAQSMNNRNKPGEWKAVHRRARRIWLIKARNMYTLGKISHPRIIRRRLRHMRRLHYLSSNHPLMRAIDRLLAEYGESHQNPTNKMV